MRLGNTVPPNQPVCYQTSLWFLKAQVCSQQAFSLLGCCNISAAAHAALALLFCLQLRTLESISRQHLHREQLAALMDQFGMYRSLPSNARQQLCNQALRQLEEARLQSSAAATAAAADVPASARARQAFAAAAAPAAVATKVVAVVKPVSVLQLDKLCACMLTSQVNVPVLNLGHGPFLQETA